MRRTRFVSRSICTSFAPPSTIFPWCGAASSMTHRLLSRSACRPCVHTNRSSGERPGRHSFQSPPGNGLKLPSAVASPTDGVGTSVQRGKLPKSLPRRETAALVIMTLPDEATVASSMWPTILQRPPGLDTCVDTVLRVAPWASGERCARFSASGARWPWAQCSCSSRSPFRSAVSLRAYHCRGASSESLAALARGEWPTYAGTYASAKYSPLDQITPANVGDLKVAWRWTSPDHAVRSANAGIDPSRFHDGTPIMVKAPLDSGTSLSQVSAIEAATGQRKWVFDPGAWKLGMPTNLGWVHRGVAYWRDGEDERVLMLTGHASMIALNARTGQPIDTFGDKGMV